MKIFSISDLHLFGDDISKSMEIFGGEWENYIEKIIADWNEKVSDDDIVLIAGDISWAMTLSAALKDIEKIGTLKGKKIITRGNHDYWWSSISAIRNALPNKMYAIQNDAIKIGEYIFCGVKGYTVPEYEFKNDEAKKLYYRELGRLELSLKEAKRKQENGETIIAMIHYPPFNSNLYPSDFTNLFSDYGVKYVVYGHLHHKSKSEMETEIDGVKYYLTSCDKLKNKLKLITEGE